MFIRVPEYNQENTVYLNVSLIHFFSPPFSGQKGQRFGNNEGTSSTENVSGSTV